MNQPLAASSQAGNLPNWLNARQRDVVQHDDGPLLILAGAGTGKTSALTERLAALVRDRDIWPSQILAVTFTNKAAGVMRERVANVLGAEQVPYWLGTFHAISGRMLRAHAEHVGLQSDFSILDTIAARRVIAELARDIGIDTKIWPEKRLAATIDHWKNRAFGPNQIPTEEGENFAEKRGVELYRNYRLRLQEMNAVDFGDLILHMVHILQHHPDIVSSYQQKFRHILVDEYQDTNAAQYLWLRLLVGGSGNVCCVGDDDQAIYGWRGGQVEHILRFEEDFPNARIIRLEQNYRSTGHILGAGVGLISANARRFQKILWTEAEQGEPIRIGEFVDGRREGIWITDEIERLSGAITSKSHIPYDRIAILVRASYLMRGIEEQLTFVGIPYRVVGGLRFYARIEIRTAISYLQLVVQPTHWVAFDYAANNPRRGLGEVSLRAIRKIGRERQLPVLEAARIALAEGRVAGSGRGGLARMIESIENWRAAHREQLPPAELLKKILAESGYQDMLQNESGSEAEGRRENLGELLGMLKDYTSIESFLDHVALIQDDPEKEDNEARVSLMTMHAAKGLEFEAVFLPGWEDEVLPSPRTVEAGGHNAIEEERRIAHVAITRAKRYLAISYAGTRYSFGRMQPRTPSRFLVDLPASHVAYVRQENPDRGLNQVSSLEARAANVQGYRSPGWSRLRANLKHATSGKATRRPPPTSIFAPDSRVFHNKFGYGRVVSLNGLHIVVEFDTGEKTVIGSFLSKAPPEQQ